MQRTVFDNLHVTNVGSLPQQLLHAASVVRQPCRNGVDGRSFLDTYCTTAVLLAHVALSKIILLRCADSLHCPNRSCHREYFLDLQCPVDSYGAHYRQVSRFPH